MHLHVNFSPFQAKLYQGNEAVKKIARRRWLRLRLGCWDLRHCRQPQFSRPMTKWCFEIFGDSWLILLLSMYLKVCINLFVYYTEHFVSKKTYMISVAIQRKFCILFLFPKSCDTKKRIRVYIATNDNLRHLYCVFY